MAENRNLRDSELEKREKEWLLKIKDAHDKFVRPRGVSRNHGCDFHHT
ncbi:MAG: hypothetical protein NUW37_13580 [Planctomycetes bacterium]|nr:hypothetical protein [Planctomycetota bacterium]